MKQGIHPEYNKVIFLDTTTDFKFLSGSTRTSNETMEWEDGKESEIDRFARCQLVGREECYRVWKLRGDCAIRNLSKPSLSLNYYMVFVFKTIKTFGIYARECSQVCEHNYQTANSGPVREPAGFLQLLYTTTPVCCGIL